MDADTVTENLNPTLSQELQNRLAAKVDWKQAPLGAAAYICACIERDEMKGDELTSTRRWHGCWYLGNHSRVQAPDFGITELEPGQAFTVRHPHTDNYRLGIFTLHQIFQDALIKQARLELLPPGPGYRRPTKLLLTPMYHGISYALATQYTGA